MLIFPPSVTRAIILCAYLVLNVVRKARCGRTYRSFRLDMCRGTYLSLKGAPLIKYNYSNAGFIEYFHKKYSNIPTSNSKRTRRTFWISYDQKSFCWSRQRDDVEFSQVASAFDFFRLTLWIWNIGGELIHFLIKLRI